MPSSSERTNTLEVFLACLRESHDVCAYEAIERLVQAGEAAGLDVHTLIRKLDNGMTLEELFELVEARMETLQAA